MPVLGQFPTEIHLIDTNTVAWTAGPDYPDPNFPNYAVRDVTANVVIGGVDSRTTTTETISASDYTKLVTLDNGSATAVTLDSTVVDEFFCAVMNIGAGTATLTPSFTAQIWFDAAMVGSITLVSGQTAVLFFDGANWYAYVVTNGTLQVSQGGTGDATLTAHAVLLGEGTSPIGFATVGTSGRVLTDNGASSDPSFQTTASLGLATQAAIQAESYTYAQDTGSANAIAIAPSPAIGAYAAGQGFQIKVAAANTTATTIAVSALATKAVKKWSSGSLVNLASGDLSIGQIIYVKYDGTVFQVLGGLSPSAGTTVPTPVVEEVVTFSGTAGTLANTPSAVTGYTKTALYRDGQRLHVGGGNDYTISGANITLATASPGSVFLCDYYM